MNISLTKGDSSLQTIETPTCVVGRLVCPRNFQPAKTTGRLSKTRGRENRHRLHLKSRNDRVFALGDNSIQREYEKGRRKSRGRKPSHGASRLPSRGLLRLERLVRHQQNPLLAFTTPRGHDDLFYKEAAVQFPVGEETTLDGPPRSLCVD